MTDEFRQHLETLHQDLSIPADYIDGCAMPVQFEASKLCNAGCDIFEREQSMTEETLDCWNSMKSAALADGIELQLVSAFRSIEYQCQLIKNKLAKGQNINDILKVNAAPGFSEHHTGRALDLTTVDVEPLTEEFDQTDAFVWLERNANKHHFKLSFPRHNPFGIIYEPWHWACHK